MNGAAQVVLGVSNVGADGRTRTEDRLFIWLARDVRGGPSQAEILRSATPQWPSAVCVAVTGAVRLGE